MRFGADQKPLSMQLFSRRHLKGSGLVHTYTLNKGSGLSPDPLRLSSAERSTVSSNLLISFFPRGATGLVRAGLQSGMKLRLSAPSLQEVALTALVSGGSGVTLCIKEPEFTRDEGA